MLSEVWDFVKAVFDALELLRWFLELLAPGWGVELPE